MASVFATPAAQALPLRAWSDAALAQLASHVDAIVRAWAAEWGVSSPSLGPVHCEACGKDIDSGGRWKSFRHEQGDAAWIQWGEGSGAALADALFHVRDCSTPMLSAVLAACRDDFVRRLSVALGLSPRSADAVCSAPVQARPWSGTVSLSLPWGGRLILEAGVVMPLLASADPSASQALAPALVRVTEALADYPTRLHARLDPCEIALAELRDLRPGDVLRLTHRVNAPITLADLAGASLFEGWLARRAGRKAVELVARDPH